MCPSISILRLNSGHQHDIKCLSNLRSSPHSSAKAFDKPSFRERKYLETNFPRVNIQVCSRPFSSQPSIQEPRRDTVEGRSTNPAPTWFSSSVSPDSGSDIPLSTTLSSHMRGKFICRIAITTSATSCLSSYLPLSHYYTPLQHPPLSPSPTHHILPHTPN